MKNMNLPSPRAVHAQRARRWKCLGTVLAMLACLGVAAPTVCAQEVSAAVAKRLRDAIQSNTQGKIPVDGVAASPIPGIYQIASEGEIFYVDETGRYSLVGASMVDMKLQKDLTTPALDKLQAIDFKSLPLQDAIKEVHGKGTRKMALFEDPNCPVCRVFTKFVDQLEDVTIYRFMYPVISPQSQSLARVAWCSKDRAGVWKAVMAGARPSGDESCDVRGLAGILALGDRYHINNTPTVVLASGKRLVGATPPEQFMVELDAGGR